MPEPRMTHRDFSTYLASFLVLQGTKQFPHDDRFHQSLEGAFNRALPELEREGFIPDFRIRTDRLHGDSQTVRDIIFCMFQSCIGRYYSPGDGFMHFNLTTDLAERFVKHITPTAKEIFQRIAKETMENIDKPQGEPEPAGIES